MRKRSTRVAVSHYGLILKIRRLERNALERGDPDPARSENEKLRSDRNCFLFLRSGRFVAM
jgi:hypothetical protein